MNEVVRWRRLAGVMREVGGLVPSRQQLHRFAVYLDQIMTWSRAQRLTGFRTPEEIVEHIFLASLLFLPLIPARPCRLVDVGSGVGAPGIPLRIADPGLSLTLVEARRKRVSFLRAALRALDLQDVQVLHGRAEQLIGKSPELAGSYDGAVMRSVGHPESVVPMVEAYLKPGGSCILSGPPDDGRELSSPYVPGFSMTRTCISLPSLDLQRAFLVFVKIP